MKPIRTLANTLSTLMAADTAFLAAVAAPKVALIGAAFAPSLDRVLLDLTILAGNGLDPIAGVAGTQLESVDPVTGELIVELKVPVGGFRWETSGGLAVNKTIHGFAVLNNAATVLLATESLPAPLTVNADNQSITAPPLKIRIDPTKIV